MRIKASTIVLDEHRQASIRHCQPDLDLARAGVLLDVAQGLLDDAQHGNFGERVQHNLPGCTERGLDTGLLAKSFHLLLDGPGEAELIESQGPEIVDEVPDLLDLAFQAPGDLL